MVDPTQMCPSLISPLGMFQGIICNIDRLKFRTLEPLIAGGTEIGQGPNLKRGDLRPLFMSCYMTIM